MEKEKCYGKKKKKKLNIGIHKRVKLNSSYRDKFDSFFEFVDIKTFIRCRSPPLFNLILKNKLNGGKKDGRSPKKKKI